MRGVKDSSDPRESRDSVRGEGTPVTPGTPETHGSKRRGEGTPVTPVTLKDSQFEMRGVRDSSDPRDSSDSQFKVRREGTLESKALFIVHITFTVRPNIFQIFHPIPRGPYFL